MTPVHRIFLGWDGPILERAAAWLIDEHAGPQELDLGRTIVITPVARAARWIEGMLVDRAHESGLLLTPPMIIPAARLHDVIRGGTPASDAAKTAAWFGALHADKANAVAIGATGDLWPWAHALRRSSDRLATRGHSFHTLSMDPIGNALAEDESKRLKACAVLWKSYKKSLHADGLSDALDHTIDTEPLADRDVVLVAIPEDGAGVFAAIAQRARRVTSLVMAPEQLADRFDDLGVPIPEKWVDAELPLRSSEIRFCADPLDQAHGAWECVADLGQEPTARDVVIGVIDGASASAIGRVAAQQGVRTRDAAGRPMRLTTVHTLLSRLADHLRQNSLASLLALVQHPDVERRLDCTDAPHAIDAYLARTELRELPGTLDDWPDMDERESEVIPQVYRGVQAFMSGCDRGARVELCAHAASIGTVLGAIYAGREFKMNSPRTGALIAGLDAVTACIQSLMSSRVMCGAHECVALLASAVSEQSVPPELDEEAIELLGWLELATDPAPVCILCDASETRLPSRVPLDPFVPRSLIERFGLPTDASRAGRDAYLLGAIAASKRTVRVIACGGTQEGDPLSPSRLLFRAAQKDVLERLDRSSAERRDPVRTSRLQEPEHSVRTSGGFPERPAVPSRGELDKWPVTRFRLYLDSPYAFYVTQVLRRRESRESQGELDPSAFGELLHEALRRYGKDVQSRVLLDEAQIADAMGTYLHDASQALHGADPPASVWLQIEQARMRLRRFAQVQAAWAQQGWVPTHTEWSPGSGAVLEVPGQSPITLVGRIDRIDYNQQTGAHAIIDYKTGKDGKGPEATHRVKDEWRDLQLPLYRRLAAEMGVGQAPVLAYATLPPSASATAIQIARWDAETLDDAEACAQGVVMRVRAKQWEDEGDRPIKRGVLGALGGHGLISGGTMSEVSE